MASPRQAGIRSQTERCFRFMQRLLITSPAAPTLDRIMEEVVYAGLLQENQTIGTGQSLFCRVKFHDRLVTNHGREITPRNGMTAQAEIITHHMRLLEIVVNNIIKDLR